MSVVITTYLLATQLESLRRDAIELDVLGLNYYPFMSVWHRSLGEGATVRHQARWGGGAALEGVVREYHERYRAPMFVTGRRSEPLPMPVARLGPPGARGSTRA